MPIDKTFAFHHPSDASKDKINTLRAAYTDLRRTLGQLCPPSREASVAFTELETSAMWAIKSVVSNDPTSTPEVTDQGPSQSPA